MSLLNPDGYYFFDVTHWENGEPQMRCDWREGAPKIYHTRDFTTGGDYYYLEFKEGEAFRKTQLRHILAPEVLRAIKDHNSDTYLIVNNSHEAFLSCVEPIYRYLIMGHNIPTHKLILISGAFDIEEEIERVRPMYKKDAIKVELSLDFEDNTVSTLQAQVHEGTFTPPRTMVDKVYDKAFINFNRRWRVHRPTFVALLKHRNLLDRGFVSLAPADDHMTWEDGWKSIVTMNQDFPWIVSIAYDLKDELLSMPPLYLDTDDLVTNRANLQDSTNYLYEQSYFSVVSETNFYTCHSGYEASKFLSEKAFKPILYKHPFIFISTPGTLSCLKQIGYKTFDGLIDESYDTIADDGERMLAVLNEVERLSNLSPQEVSDFVNQARDICSYNYRVLFNKTKFQHRLNY